MLAAWGDSTEEEDEIEEKKAAVALMAKSDLELDEEPLDSLALLKEKVSGLSKPNLIKLLFTLVDEYTTENSMLEHVLF